MQKSMIGSYTTAVFIEAWDWKRAGWNPAAEQHEDYTSALNTLRGIDQSPDDTDLDIARIGLSELYLWMRDVGLRPQPGLKKPLPMELLWRVLQALALKDAEENEE